MLREQDLSSRLLFPHTRIVKDNYICHAQHAAVPNYS